MVTHTVLGEIVISHYDDYDNFHEKFYNLVEETI